MKKKVDPKDDSTTLGKPEQLLLGVDKYEIRFKAGLEGADLGSVIYREQQINICSNQSLFEQRRTLLHEVVHICLAHSGVYAEASEPICRQIEYPLFEVLNRNPEVVRFINGT